MAGCIFGTPTQVPLQSSGLQALTISPPPGAVVALTIFFNNGSVRVNVANRAAPSRLEKS